MSSDHYTYVQVSRYQANEWNRAAQAAAQAASSSAAIARQQAEMERRRQADAEALRRQIDARAAEDRRRADSLSERVHSLDTSLSDRIREQDNKRETMRRELERRINESEQRSDQRNAQAMSKIEDVRSNVEQLSSRVDETQTRLAETETKLEGEIQRAQAQLRSEVQRTRAEIMSDFRRELNRLTDDIIDLQRRQDIIERRVAATEHELEIIKQERRRATELAESKKRIAENLMEDLISRECDRFCPGKLNNVTRRYNEALLSLQDTLDPAVSLMNLQFAINDMIELRTEVMMREGHFEELRYEYFTIISQFRSISGPDYMVPSSQEGYLFNLREMSNGKLDEFNATLDALEERLNTGNCTSEDLASLREDLKKLPAQYEAIVNGAILFEAASEEAKTQSRNIVERMNRAGFRLVGVEAREDQSNRLIFNCSMRDGIINQLVIDVIPDVHYDSHGEPVVGYSYRQRVFVRDARGRFLTHYDPTIVSSSLSIIEQVTGSKLGLAEGGREGVAADESEYADVLATFDRLANK